MHGSSFESMEIPVDWANATTEQTPWLIRMDGKVVSCHVGPLYVECEMRGQGWAWLIASEDDKGAIDIFLSDDGTEEFPQPLAQTLAVAHAVAEIECRRLHALRNR
jgi:hypothetical protein